MPKIKRKPKKETPAQKKRERRAKFGAALITGSSLMGAAVPIGEQIFRAPVKVARAATRLAGSPAEVRPRRTEAGAGKTPLEEVQVLRAELAPVGAADLEQMTPGESAAVVVSNPLETEANRKIDFTWQLPDGQEHTHTATTDQQGRVEFTVDENVDLGKHTLEKISDGTHEGEVNQEVVVVAPREEGLAPEVRARESGGYTAPVPPTTKPVKEPPIIIPPVAPPTVTPEVNRLKSVHLEGGPTLNVNDSYTIEVQGTTGPFANQQVTLYWDYTDEQGSTREIISPDIALNSQGRVSFTVSQDTPRGTYRLKTIAHGGESMPVNQSLRVVAPVVTVSQLVLDKTSLTLEEDKITTVSGEVQMSDGSTNYDFKLQSNSNPEIADLSDTYVAPKTGKTFGIKAKKEGTTTLTFASNQDSGKTATLEVKVTPAPTTTIPEIKLQSAQVIALGNTDLLNLKNQDKYKIKVMGSEGPLAQAKITTLWDMPGQQNTALDFDLDQNGEIEFTVSQDTPRGEYELKEVKYNEQTTPVSQKLVVIETSAKTEPVKNLASAVLIEAVADPSGYIPYLQNLIDGDKYTVTVIGTLGPLAGASVVFDWTHTDEEGNKKEITTPAIKLDADGKVEFTVSGGTPRGEYQLKKIRAAQEELEVEGQKLTLVSERHIARGSRGISIFYLPVNPAQLTLEQQAVNHLVRALTQKGQPVYLGNNTILLPNAFQTTDWFNSLGLFTYPAGTMGGFSITTGKLGEFLGEIVNLKPQSSKLLNFMVKNGVLEYQEGKWILPEHTKKTGILVITPESYVHERIHQLFDLDDEFLKIWLTQFNSMSVVDQLRVFLSLKTMGYGGSITAAEFLSEAVARLGTASSDENFLVLFKLYKGNLGRVLQSLAARLVLGADNLLKRVEILQIEYSQEKDKFIIKVMGEDGQEVLATFEFSSEEFLKVFVALEDEPNVALEYSKWANRLIKLLSGNISSLPSDFNGTVVLKNGQIINVIQGKPEWGLFGGQVSVGSDLALDDLISKYGIEKIFVNAGVHSGAPTILAVTPIPPDVIMNAQTGEKYPPGSYYIVYSNHIVIAVDETGKFLGATTTILAGFNIGPRPAGVPANALPLPDGNWVVVEVTPKGDIKTTVYDQNGNIAPELNKPGGVPEAANWMGNGWIYSFRNNETGDSVQILWDKNGNSTYVIINGMVTELEPEKDFTGAIIGFKPKGGSANVGQLISAANRIIPIGPGFEGLTGNQVPGLGQKGYLVIGAGGIIVWVPYLAYSPPQPKVMESTTGERTLIENKLQSAQALPVGSADLLALKDGDKYKLKVMGTEGPLANATIKTFWTVPPETIQDIYGKAREYEYQLDKNGEIEFTISDKTARGDYLLKQIQYNEQKVEVGQKLKIVPTPVNELSGLVVLPEAGASLLKLRTGDKYRIVLNGTLGNLANQDVLLKWKITSEQGRREVETKDRTNASGELSYQISGQTEPGYYDLLSATVNNLTKNTNYSLTVIGALQAPKIIALDKASYAPGDTVIITAENLTRGMLGNSITMRVAGEEKGFAIIGEQPINEKQISFKLHSDKAEGRYEVSVTTIAGDSQWIPFEVKKPAPQIEISYAQVIPIAGADFTNLKIGDKYKLQVQGTTGPLANATIKTFWTVPPETIQDIYGKAREYEYKLDAKGEIEFTISDKTPQGDYVLKQVQYNDQKVEVNQKLRVGAGVEELTIGGQTQDFTVSNFAVGESIGYSIKVKLSDGNISYDIGFENKNPDLVDIEILGPGTPASTFALKFKKLGSGSIRIFANQDPARSLTLSYNVTKTAIGIGYQILEEQGNYLKSLENLKLGEIFKLRTWVQFSDGSSGPIIGLPAPADNVILEYILEPPSASNEWSEWKYKVIGTGQTKIYIQAHQDGKVFAEVLVNVPAVNQITSAQVLPLGNADLANLKDGDKYKLQVQGTTGPLANATVKTFWQIPETDPYWRQYRATKEAEYEYQLDAQGEIEFTVSDKTPVGSYLLKQVQYQEQKVEVNQKLRLEARLGLVIGVAPANPREVVSGKVRAPLLRLEFSNSNQEAIQISRLDLGVEPAQVTNLEIYSNNVIEAGPVDPVNNVAKFTDPIIINPGQTKTLEFRGRVGASTGTIKLSLNKNGVLGKGTTSGAPIDLGIFQIYESTLEIVSGTLTAAKALAQPNLLQVSEWSDVLNITLKNGPEPSRLRNLRFKLDTVSGITEASLLLDGQKIAGLVPTSTALTFESFPSPEPKISAQTQAELVLQLKTEPQEPGQVPDQVYAELESGSALGLESLKVFSLGGNFPIGNTVFTAKAANRISRASLLPLGSADLANLKIGDKYKLQVQGTDAPLANATVKTFWSVPPETIQDVYGKAREYEYQLDANGEIEFTISDKTPQGDYVLKQVQYNEQKVEVGQKLKVVVTKLVPTRVWWYSDSEYSWATDGNKLYFFLQNDSHENVLGKWRLVFKNILEQKQYFTDIEIAAQGQSTAVEVKIDPTLKSDKFGEIPGAFYLESAIRLADNQEFPLMSYGGALLVLAQSPERAKATHYQIESPKANEKVSGFQEVTGFIAYDPMYPISFPVVKIDNQNYLAGWVVEGERSDIAPSFPGMKVKQFKVGVNFENYSEGQHTLTAGAKHLYPEQDGTVVGNSIVFENVKKGQTIVIEKILKEGKPVSEVKAGDEIEIIGKDLKVGWYAVSFFKDQAGEAYLAADSVYSDGQKIAYKISDELAAKAHGNVFLRVARDDSVSNILPLTIRAVKLPEVTAVSDGVFAMVADELALGKTYYPLDYVTRVLQNLVRDSTDFIALVPSKAIQEKFKDSRLSFGQYLWHTKADIKGIFPWQEEKTPDRLQALVQVTAPKDGNIDVATLMELGHRWGVFWDFPYREVNDQVGAHWGRWYSDASAMSYSNWVWTDNKDGTFKADVLSLAELERFNDLDLYAMGLMAPPEVKPSFAIRDAKRIPGENNKVTGKRLSLTVEDIIKLNGLRQPGPEASQKEFTIAFLYLKMPGEDVSQEQQNVVEASKKLNSTWQKATRGKSTMKLLEKEALQKLTAQEITALAKEAESYHYEQSAEVLELLEHEKEGHERLSLAEVMASIPEAEALSTQTATAAASAGGGGGATINVPPVQGPPVQTPPIERQPESVIAKPKAEAIPMQEKEIATPLDRLGVRDDRVIKETPPRFVPPVVEPKINVAEGLSLPEADKSADYNADQNVVSPFMGSEAKVVADESASYKEIGNLKVSATLASSLSNEQYVHVLYRGILGREADAAGYDYWTDMLARGLQTREQVLEAFLLSPEAQSKDFDNETFVSNLYAGIHGRKPDAGGFAYWADALQNGQSREAVSRAFLESEELAKYGYRLP